jgi:amino acid transporter
MRQAFKAQGDDALKLPYAFKNRLWPLGSVFLVVTSVLILASTFYVSLYPIDGPTTAKNFFQTFLCVPMFIVVFLVYKIAYKTKWVNPAEADIHSGRRPLTEQEIEFLDKYYAQPWHKRALTYVTF